MSVVVIGVVVGTLLLTIVIIINIVIVMIVCRRRKKSRRADDKNVQLSSADLPQQYPYNDSSQSDHVITLTELADRHDPTRLETSNALYIPTKIKSLDSLLKRIDDRFGIGVTITPNPSYSQVGPSLLQSGKELEYDYVQTEDGLVGHDKVVNCKCTTSEGVYDEIIDVTMDTVNIDPNLAHLVGENAKLEDKPFYDKL